MMAQTTHDKYHPPLDMRKFVHVLLSEEVRGNKSEAERQSGVNRQRFYYYFNRYPKFRQWFSDQCDTFLGINEGIPSFMLMKKILSGDVQAIRTYYELRGKLRRQIEGAEFGSASRPVVIMIRTTQGTESTVTLGTNGNRHSVDS